MPCEMKILKLEKDYLQQMEQSMSGEKEFWEKTLSVFNTHYDTPVPSTEQLKSWWSFQD